MKKLFLSMALLFTFTVSNFAQTSSPTIVVSTFTTRGQGISSDDAESITELCIAELAKQGGLRVVDRSILDRVLYEMEFQMNDWSDPIKTAKLGDALNANYIVRGQLNQLGNMVTFVLTAYDIKTLEVVASVTQQIKRSKLYDTYDDNSQYSTFEDSSIFRNIKWMTKSIVGTIHSKITEAQSAGISIVGTWETGTISTDVNNINDYLKLIFNGNGQFTVEEYSWKLGDVKYLYICSTSGNYTKSGNILEYAMTIPYKRYTYTWKDGKYQISNTQEKLSKSISNKIAISITNSGRTMSGKFAFIQSDTFNTLQKTSDSATLASQQKTTPTTNNPANTAPTSQPKNVTSTNAVTRTAAYPANMVRIEGGTFSMGSPSSEADRGVGETQHQVTVSAFYMGMYEVTQAEYQEVMGTNPSSFKGNNLPVENVSWFDAVRYCNMRSEKENLTPAYTISGSTENPFVQWSNKNANGYRLPTEAEWEYACRAGTRTPFNTGNNITTSQANYNGNYPYNGNSKGTYREKTTNVGSFAPNSWGLYDMHGNVWEWCWDWYGDYSSGAQTDPTGAASGSYRVLRGGSWSSYARSLRSAFRFYYSPTHRILNFCFRVVRS